MKVNNNNYKLLQILDLLDNFDKYSEFDFMNIKDNLLSYLENINLSSNEVMEIVDKYPLKTQVSFYKMGGLNVAT